MNVFMKLTTFSTVSRCASGVTTLEHVDEVAATSDICVLSGYVDTRSALVTFVMSMTNWVQRKVNRIKDATLHQPGQVRHDVDVVVLTEAVIELKQQRSGKDATAFFLLMFQCSLQTFNGFRWPKGNTDGRRYTYTPCP